MSPGCDMPTLVSQSAAGIGVNPGVGGRDAKIFEWRGRVVSKKYYYIL